jgi:predicted DNA binding CopG/RHH family protein
MVTAILNEIFSISALVRVQSELRELNFKSIIRECQKNDAFLSLLETHFFAIQNEQMQQQELQDQEEKQRLKEFMEEKQKKRKAFHGIIPEKSDVPFRIPAVEAVEAVKPKP